MPHQAAPAERAVIATVYTPSHLRPLLDAAGLRTWDLDNLGLLPRREDNRCAKVIDVGEGNVLVADDSCGVIDAQSVERIRRFLRLWQPEADPEQSCTVGQLVFAAFEPWGLRLGSATLGEVVLACLLEDVRLRQPSGRVAARRGAVLTDVPLAALETADKFKPTPSPGVLRHELVGDYLQWLKAEQKRAKHRWVVRA